MRAVAAAALATIITANTTLGALLTGDGGGPLGTAPDRRPGWRICSPQRRRH